GAAQRAPQVDPVEHTPHVGPVQRAPQRSTVVYTVRSGDTVSELAARYDTTVRAIVNANDLNSRALIRIGQTLRIPSGTSGSSSSGSRSSAGGSPARTGSASAYTVRSGDTVSGIAARHDTTVRAIIHANDLNSRALIRIGQTLRIPGSSSSSSSGSSSSGGSSSAGGSAAGSSSSSTYTVRSGDTVSGIAARHDTTVRAIINAND